MSDPFQRLRWALGKSHHHIVRLDDFRADVRRLVGVNEEWAMASSVADDVDGLDPLGAAEVAADRMKAELFGALAKRMAQKVNDVWASYLGAPLDTDGRLQTELRVALTKAVRNVLDDHEIGESDQWQVVLFEEGDAVPEHIKLVGSKLLRASGYTVGDGGEKLVALGRQDEGARVVYCEPHAIPVVALGHGWEDEEPVEPELTQPIEVVGEADLRSAVKGATEDIDDALADLE